MAFRFRHSETAEDGIRRIAAERLDAALERIDGLGDLPADEVEAAVHDVRKRTKEVRGVLRLVRPVLGKEYGRCNRPLREGAGALAALRDAQALSATFADLRRAEGDRHDHAEALEVVQRALTARAEGALGGRIERDDARVVTARQHIAGVRERVDRWQLPSGFDALVDGLQDTYRRGRRGLREARRDTTDERMHEWRKAVKHLWYQARLLEPTAPSVLAPLVDRLDDLSDALGDDHDLAVLVHDLGEDPERFGDEDQVGAAVDLARHRQADLRERAFALGSRLYVEKPKAFVGRMRDYWDIDRDDGEEPRVGSIADLADLADLDDRDATTITTVERERKFLVAGDPPIEGDGDHIRQGYVAIDIHVAARVRERSGAEPVLTIKAGSGATRTELEWILEPERFDALWPLAEGRCIDKTRYEAPLGDHTAEIDIFGGDLEGLRLVEVEFADEETMAAFEPPEWFGPEVTDDDSYSNARLAVDGWERVV